MDQAYKIIEKWHAFYLCTKCGREYKNVNLEKGEVQLCLHMFSDGNLCRTVNSPHYEVNYQWKKERLFSFCVNISEFTVDKVNCDHCDTIIQFIFGFISVSFVKLMRIKTFKHLQASHAYDQIN